ncbi:MAG: transposase, partial [Actinobacteria bacterium]|nr:transposase [Actinomycetota bacterium]
FLPAMKFIEKTRIGSRVTKKYDEAKTPCRRLLLSVDLPAKTKEGLQARYATLNPAELKRSILKLQDRLLNLSRLKEEIRRKKVLTAEDFEYISDEATNHQLGYIST